MILRKKGSHEKVEFWKNKDSLISRSVHKPDVKVALKPVRTFYRYSKPKGAE